MDIGLIFLIILVTSYVIGIITQLFDDGPVSVTAAAAASVMAPAGEDGLEMQGWGLDDVGIILTLTAFFGIPIFAIWFVIFRLRPRPQGAEDCRRCNGTGWSVGACQYCAGRGWVV